MIETLSSLYLLAKVIMHIFGFKKVHADGILNINLLGEARAYCIVGNFWRVQFS